MGRRGGAGRSHAAHAATISALCEVQAHPHNRHIVMRQRPAAALPHLYSSRPSVVAAAQLRPVGDSETCRVRMMGARCPPAPQGAWGRACTSWEGGPPKKAQQGGGCPACKPQLQMVHSSAGQTRAGRHGLASHTTRGRTGRARTGAGQATLPRHAAGHGGRQQVVCVTVLVLDLVQRPRIGHVPAEAGRGLLGAQLRARACLPAHHCPGCACEKSGTRQAWSRPAGRIEPLASGAVCDAGQPSVLLLTWS